MDKSHDRVPSPAPASQLCPAAPGLSIPNTRASDFPSAPPASTQAADRILAIDPLAGFFYEGLVSDPVIGVRDALFSAYLNDWAAFNAMLRVVDAAATAELAHTDDPNRAVQLAGLRPSIAEGKRAFRECPTDWELDVLLGLTHPATLPCTARFVAEAYEAHAPALAHRLRVYAGEDPALREGAQSLLTLLGDPGYEPVVGDRADPVEAQAKAAETEEVDEEGFGSFLEGALIGDLAENDSWSALAGQTLMGLVPIAGQIADARDTLAALNEVADAKPGAWLKLAAAGIGWIPGIGDALKGGARVGMRLGTDVVEEGGERLLHEVAEEGSEIVAKQGDEAGQASARALDADPSRALLGAGRQSHPELYAQLLDEVEALGVVVKLRPGAMAYGPSPSGGAPGQLLLDPDASITALLHEVQHARDDAAQGFPGMRRLFDPDARWTLEQNAYDAEIHFMDESGLPGSAEVIDQLRANQALERLAIYGE